LGSDGLTGRQGKPGKQGVQGIPGKKGERGFQGEIGFRGPVGIKGEPGKPGKQGNTGFPGQKGSVGQKGSTGDTGNQGSKGEIGLKGIPGDVGPSGKRGELGHTGQKGTKGDTGSRGETGSQGLDGQKGQKGEAADVNQIVHELSRPTFPAINFVYDQSININESELTGSSPRIGTWIYSDHVDKHLWQGGSSLLIEYYIEDTTDSADWKLEFTETSDSYIDTPKVAVGPFFGSKSNSSVQKYIGQTFVPVSPTGQLAYKFSTTKIPTINLIRLRVIGFI
jgi:hypothetical protein